MPIRFTVDGVQYEADTAMEVVQLRTALQANEDRSRQKPGATVSRPTLFPPRPQVPLTPEARARAIFRDEHYPAFLLLYSTDGVQTADLMKPLGFTNPKSLPPTTATWRTRAKEVGVDDLLLVTRKFTKGKATTLYKLTQQARDMLRPETEPAHSAVS